MFEELGEFLNLAVGEDSANEILSAAEALLTINYTDHVDAFTDYLAQAENQETIVAVDAIRQQLDDCYRKVFQTMGIQLVDEPVRLEVMTAILRALVLVDDYEDKGSILSFCGDSTTPEETLGELVEFLTPISWVDVLPVLSEVKGQLISRIVEVCEAAENLKLTTADAEVIDVTQQKVRAKSYLEAHQDTFAEEALLSGIPLGAPFEALVGNFIERIEPLAPAAAAKELVGLLLISEVPDSKLSEALSEELEKIFTDINHLSKVNVTASELMRGVSYAQT